MKKILIPEGHKIVSRRDFISFGLMEAPAFLLMPSLYGLLMKSKAAWADGCDGNAATRSGMMPLLIFDLAGGIGWLGNFVARDQGGSLLASYSTCARGGSDPGAIVSPFGVPMFSDSQILAGLNFQIGGLTPEQRNAIKMIIGASVSQDDSSSNPLNFAILAAKAGLVGRDFNGLVAPNGGNTGGNSISTLNDPALRPIAITNATSVQDSLNLGDVLKNLPLTQQQRMVAAVDKLNQSQISKLSRMTGFEALSELHGCSIDKTKSLVASGGNTEVIPSAAAKTLYNFDNNVQDAGFGGQQGANQTARQRQCQVVYNVLNGTSGFGTIVIGGCDYHGNSGVQERNKDFEVGMALGRAVNLAAQMNKPFTFALISDGSVSSQTNSTEWASDSGDKGSWVMGVFDPTLRAGLIDPQKTQLGHYKNTVAGGSSVQTVDATTYIGGSRNNAALVKRSAYAMLLNYLVMAKGSQGESLFQKLVASNEFDRAQIANHIIFKG